MIHRRSIALLLSFLIARAALAAGVLDLVRSRPAMPREVERQLDLIPEDMVAAVSFADPEEIAQSVEKAGITEQIASAAALSEGGGLAAKIPLEVRRTMIKGMVMAALSPERVAAELSGPVTFAAGPGEGGPEVLVIGRFSDPEESVLKMGTLLGAALDPKPRKYRRKSYRVFLAGGDVRLAYYTRRRRLVVANDVELLERQIDLDEGHGDSLLDLREIEGDLEAVGGGEIFVYADASRLEGTLRAFEALLTRRLSGGGPLGGVRAVVTKSIAFLWRPDAPEGQPIDIAGCLRISPSQVSSDWRCRGTGNRRPGAPIVPRAWRAIDPSRIAVLVSWQTDLAAWWRGVVAGEADDVRSTIAKEVVAFEEKEKRDLEDEILPLFGPEAAIVASHVDYGDDRPRFPLPAISYMVETRTNDFLPALLDRLIDEAMATMKRQSVHPALKARWRNSVNEAVTAGRVKREDVPELPPFPFDVRDREVNGRKVRRVVFREKLSWEAQPVNQLGGGFAPSYAFWGDWFSASTSARFLEATAAGEARASRRLEAAISAIPPACHRLLYIDFPNFFKILLENGPYIVDNTRGEEATRQAVANLETAVETFSFLEWIAVATSAEEGFSATRVAVGIAGERGEDG